jgi:DNA-binding NarL/FixJ family response regulator
VRPDPTWGDEDADLTTAGEQETDPGPIRLVLVEPSSIHGAAVRELLDREDDFEVVAEVRTTDEAVGLTMEEPPDVLVVDVDLPDPDAIEATRRLKRQAPDAGLVIIARDDDDEAVFRAVQAGATAQVADREGPGELVDTIRRVADGEDPLAATVAERPRHRRRRLSVRHHVRMERPDGIFAGDRDVARRRLPTRGRARAAADGTHPRPSDLHR